MFSNLYRRCVIETVTYPAARQNPQKQWIRYKDRAPVTVTRKGSNSVVIMSLDDYEPLEEAAYLFRSPKSAGRLIKSISQLENAKGIEKGVHE